MGRCENPICKDICKEEENPTCHFKFDVQFLIPTGSQNSSQNPLKHCRPVETRTCLLANNFKRDVPNQPYISGTVMDSPSYKIYPIDENENPRTSLAKIVLDEADLAADNVDEPKSTKYLEALESAANDLLNVIGKLNLIYEVDNCFNSLTSIQSQLNTVHNKLIEQAMMGQIQTCGVGSPKQNCVTFNNITRNKSNVKMEKVIDCDVRTMRNKVCGHEYPKILLDQNSRCAQQIAGSVVAGEPTASLRNCSNVIKQERVTNQCLPDCRCSSCATPFEGASNSLRNASYPPSNLTLNRSTRSQSPGLSYQQSRRMSNSGLAQYSTINRSARDQVQYTPINNATYNSGIVYPGIDAVRNQSVGLQTSAQQSRRVEETDAGYYSTPNRSVNGQATTQMIDNGTFVTSVRDQMPTYTSQLSQQPINNATISSPYINDSVFEYPFDLNQTGGVQTSTHLSRRVDATGTGYYSTPNRSARDRTVYQPNDATFDKSRYPISNATHVVSPNLSGYESDPFNSTMNRTPINNVTYQTFANQCGIGGATSTPRQSFESSDLTFSNFEPMLDSTLNKSGGGKARSMKNNATFQVSNHQSGPASNQTYDVATNNCPQAQNQTYNVSLPASKTDQGNLIKELHNSTQTLAVFDLIQEAYRIERFDFGAVQNFFNMLNGLKGNLRWKDLLLIIVENITYFTAVKVFNRNTVEEVGHFNLSAIEIEEVFKCGLLELFQFVRNRNLLRDPNALDQLTPSTVRLILDDLKEPAGFLPINETAKKLENYMNCSMEPQSAIDFSVAGNQDPDCIVDPFF